MLGAVWSELLNHSAACELAFAATAVGWQLAMLWSDFLEGR